MSNADTIREHALSLATSGTERDEAVHALERAAAGRRVAVVRARQQVTASPETGGGEPGAARAIELLDEVLGRLPA